MNTLGWTAALALWAAAASPSQAQGVALADTFGPGNTYDTSYGYSVNRIAEFAEPFSTGGGTYTLKEIDAAFFNNLRGPVVNTFNLFVETSDTHGLPSGVVLERFSFTNVPVSSEIVTATSVLHPVLSSGQTYWVVASASDGSSDVAWNESSVPGTAIYANNDGPGTAFRTDTARPAAYRVTAAPIPEAAGSVSFGLLALGLGGLVIAANKRKARRGV